MPSSQAARTKINAKSIENRPQIDEKLMKHRSGARLGRPGAIRSAPKRLSGRCCRHASLIKRECSQSGSLFCPLTQDTERFCYSDLCLDHCCQWSTTRRERLVLYSCGARRVVRSSMNSIRGRAHFELKAFAYGLHRPCKSTTIKL